MVEATTSVLEELRVRMVPIAFRVARLCSAAQVLSGLANRLGKSQGDLLPPFERARNAVHRFHSVLARDEEAEAAAQLDRLLSEIQQLRSLLGEVDALCPPADLARYIADEASVTADALGRLVEFYAEDRPRSEESVEKLLLVTRALVGREELPGQDPSAVLGALERRYLLAARADVEPAPEQVARASAVRERLLALVPGFDSAAAAADLARFRTELGDAVLGPKGLALAVSLEMTYERRREELSRDEARPFANLLNDLEGVIDSNLETPVEVVEPEDDPEGFALIDRVEEALLQGISTRTWKEAGFFLEEEEVLTIQTVLGGEACDREQLVFSAAACRAAVDCLARCHAQGDRAPDDPPPPLPRSIALTLLREASRIESELHDRIQESILRGEYLQGKSATRTLHKLSRSRLGLALLGDLPVNGRYSREAAIGEPAGPTRSEDEEALRRQLEVARLMRDALRADRGLVAGDAGAGAEPGGAGSVREQGALAGKSGSGSVAGVALLPDVEMERRVGRRKTIALWGLFVTALLSAGLYHGAGMIVKPQPGETMKPADFAHSAPLEAVKPLNTTLVATASAEWNSVPEQERQAYVRRLWTDARQKGYHRMMVMSYDGSRPVAIASEGSVHVFPPSGDLAEMARRHR